MDLINGFQELHAGEIGQKRPNPRRRSIDLDFGFDAPLNHQASDFFCV